MARKIKYHPKHNQPGLFDLTADIFDTPSDTPDVTDDIHPSILDFVVKIEKQKQNADKNADTDTHKSIEVDRSQLSIPDTLLFMSFGSGSSGNCAYIGTADQGVLIDAGVDPKRISDTLEANGLNIANVKGICLTHDHGDHVRYVYAIVRKNPHIGVYCTPKTLNGILRRHSISRRIKDYHRPIYKEFPFTVGGLELTAFDVSHDGTDNAGYFITRGSHRFTIATDLGRITPRVDYYMRQARYIMIESNYDADMLRQGSYPMHLKARIAADNGHLDNNVTAQFLAEIASPALSHIFLCHLSQDNNTPELALTAVREALTKAGITDIGDGSGSLQAQSCPMQLAALPRFEPSLLSVLR